MVILYIGPAIVPWSFLFIGIGDLEHEVVPVPGPDDLQSSGKPVHGKASRH